MVSYGTKGDFCDYDSSDGLLIDGSEGCRFQVSCPRELFALPHTLVHTSTNTHTLTHTHNLPLWSLTVAPFDGSLVLVDWIWLTLQPLVYHLPRRPYLSSLPFLFARPISFLLTTIARCWSPVLPGDDERLQAAGLFCGTSYAGNSQYFQKTG